MSGRHGSFVNRPEIGLPKLNLNFRGRFTVPDSLRVVHYGRAFSGFRAGWRWAILLTALSIAALVSGCGGITVKNGSTVTGSGSSSTLSSVQCAATSIIGANSDSCTVSLTGPAPSTGISINLSSSNSAVAVPASVTIPAGATSVSFSISITAVTTAQSTTINATAGSVSADVVIQLHPSAPMLTVNASSVSFGSVPVSTTSTQSLTLSSTGSQPVTVSAISVTGVDFSITGATLPLTLAPGQSVVVNLVFAPSVSGAEAGQLTITSNSTANPTDAISLTGTGVIAAHSVTLTWNAPTSSPDPVAGYNVYRAASGGTAYSLLNTGLDTLTTYMDYSVQSGATYDYIVRSVDAQGVESAPSNTTTATIP